MKSLAIVFLFLAFLLTDTFAQLAIIANKSVPINEIDNSQLLDFYTGDKSFWSNGESVIIFDLQQKGQLRDAFFKFLGKSPVRIKSIWMKRMLSGDADPPEFLDSEDEMLQKIASTSGAIGFVHKSKVSTAVKELKIISKN
jgi:ABC-type phosphate transport system substrate-binding protein